MNGLSFPQAPAPSQSAGLDRIDSGSFWPVIDLNDMRAAIRLDNVVTSERLYHAAVSAVAYVNEQLSHLQDKAEAVGHPTLAASNAKQVINGESIAVIRYKRAVYSYAKSLLLEAYADHDATGKTASRADAKQDQADDNRREGNYAIAELLGRQRVDSELI